MSTTKVPHATSRLMHYVRPALVMAALATSAMYVHAADDKSTASEKMEKAENKTEQVASDSWITTKVKSEILANSVSKAFKVSVKTTNGAVALSGALPNQDAIELVKMIAGKVKGVQSVDTSALAVAS